MNRNGHRHAGGLTILSAALISAVGLLWNGAHSSAAAQGYSGASSNVIVNHDVLNALPGSGLAPALAAPSSGISGSAPTQGMVVQDDRMAAANPPGEPAAIPTEVSMPEPTPPAPAPGINADLPIAAAPVDAMAAMETVAVETAAASTAAASTVAEIPARPTEPPAANRVAQAQASQEPPAETPPAAAPTGEMAQPDTSSAVTDPAEGEPADVAAEEPPSDEAAAEPAPEPDNSQPAAPIPEGGIRIIYPADLNDVPVEANAALDDLAAQMLADESMRIQIKCYASGNEETESKARRRSLARCISIRQYLFKKDVTTTRMDVRALGLRSEGQPADRVDIVPANS